MLYLVITNYCNFYLKFIYLLLIIQMDLYNYSHYYLCLFLLNNYFIIFDKKLQNLLKNPSNIMEKLIYFKHILCSFCILNIFILSEFLNLNVKYLIKYKLRIKIIF
jgi:hypothetical protein